jgi:hypothetical protein
MDASQYKDYVLFLLFIKYISDKYGNSSDFAPPVVIPNGASFGDMVALKGKARHRRQDQHTDHPAADRRAARDALSAIRVLERIFKHDQIPLSCTVGSSSKRKPRYCPAYIRSASIYRSTLTIKGIYHEHRFSCITTTAYENKKRSAYVYKQVKGKKMFIRDLLT